MIIGGSDENFGFLSVAEKLDGQLAEVVSPARLTVVVVTALPAAALVDVDDEVVLLVVEALVVLVVVDLVALAGFFLFPEETAK